MFDSKDPIWAPLLTLSFDYLSSLMKGATMRCIFQSIHPSIQRGSQYRTVWRCHEAEILIMHSELLKLTWSGGCYASIRKTPTQWTLLVGPLLRVDRVDFDNWNTSLAYLLIRKSTRNASLKTMGVTLWIFHDDGFDIIKSPTKENQKQSQVW